MTTDDDLLEQVESFAASLTATLRAVLADVEPLTATTAPGGFGVTTADPAGYSLTRAGQPFLRLRVRFVCGWDRHRHFVRVDRSEVHLLPADSTRPVIRYEFDGGTTDRIPSAHVHVHTDDPNVVGLLASDAGQSQRARRHAKKAAKGKAQHADIHLPVGGPRFRPTLEDVLQLAVEELGCDAQDGWHHHLADGREEYRRKQTRTVVRDAPEEAVAALERLGYTVTPPPAGGPEDRRDRLREL